MDTPTRRSNVGRPAPIMGLAPPADSAYSSDGRSATPDGSGVSDSRLILRSTEEPGDCAHVIAAGYLEKARDGVIREGWAKRYFVLTPVAIHYFIRRGHSTTLDTLFGEPRGVVFLRDIVDVTVGTAPVSPRHASGGDYGADAPSTPGGASVGAGAGSGSDDAGGVTLILRSNKRGLVLRAPEEDVVHEWQRLINAALRALRKDHVHGADAEVDAIMDATHGDAPAIISSLDECDPLRICAMGYLEKERDGAVRTGWARRYFVLAPTMLFYYIRHADEQEALFGDQRGCVSLRDLRSRLVVEHLKHSDGRAFCVRLVLGRRTILVRSREEAVAKAWCDTINMAVERMPPLATASPSHHAQATSARPDSLPPLGLGAAAAAGGGGAASGNGELRHRRTATAGSGGPDSARSKWSSSAAPVGAVANGGGSSDGGGGGSSADSGPVGFAPSRFSVAPQGGASSHVGAAGDVGVPATVSLVGAPAAAAAPLPPVQPPPRVAGMSMVTVVGMMGLCSSGVVTVAMQPWQGFLSVYFLLALAVVNGVVFMLASRINRESKRSKAAIRNFTAQMDSVQKAHVASKEAAVAHASMAAMAAARAKFRRRPSDDNSGTGPSDADDYDGGDDGASSGGGPAASAGAGSAGGGGSSGGGGGGAASSDRPAGPFHEGKLVAGSTLPNGPETVPMTWRNAEGPYFNTRIGPNYSSNGKKAPSAAALYDLIGVDLLRTENNHPRIGEKVVLPEFGYDGAETPLPRLFIVNVMLPEEAPSMFGAKPDGVGWHCVFYFRITDDTMRQANNLASASPAVKLLKRFVDTAATDDALRERFKMIAKLHNFGDIGLPGWLSGYNGKPVLITKSGSICKGPGYVEMDVNTHVFSFLARKTQTGYMDRTGEMDIRIGFVVQGHSDDELPEVILGGAELHRLDMSNTTKYPQA